MSIQGVKIKRNIDNHDRAIGVVAGHYHPHPDKPHQGLLIIQGDAQITHSASLVSRALEHASKLHSDTLYVFKVWPKYQGKDLVLDIKSFCPVSPDSLQTASVNIVGTLRYKSDDRALIEVKRSNPEEKPEERLKPGVVWINTERVKGGMPRGFLGKRVSVYCNLGEDLEIHNWRSLEANCNSLEATEAEPPLKRSPKVTTPAQGIKPAKTESRVPKKFDFSRR